MFHTLVQWYTDYVRSNPVVGGLVGLFGMSVVSFLLIKCPLRIANFFRKQFTTSVSFTNEQSGYSVENFACFMEWFNQNHFSALIRSYALDSSYGRDMTLGAGQGRHLFFWKRRPCWLTRERLDRQGSSYQIFYNVTITVMGRSRKPIMDMIETFRYRPDKATVGIFQLAGANWERIADVDKRPLETVIVEPAMLAQLTDSIDHFRDNREWYIQRGFPYKLTFLLHGVPGTGKTSLIKAIASHYGMNLCLLNLSTMSDESLQFAIARTPSNSIIAIEDFDSTNAVHRRRAKAAAVQPMLQAVEVPDSKWSYKATCDAPTLTTLTPAPEQAAPRETSFSFLTLSGILNALQGLLPLENKILFMTTNHLETMDDALIRKGRVDKVLEVQALADPEIRRYITMVFPELKEQLSTDTRPFASKVGCDVQSLYYDYRDDPQGFIKALPRVPLSVVPHSSPRAPVGNLLSVHDESTSMHVAEARFAE